MAYADSEESLTPPPVRHIARIFTMELEDQAAEEVAAPAAVTRSTYEYPRSRSNRMEIIDTADDDHEYGSAEERQIISEFTRRVNQAYELRDTEQHRNTLPGYGPIPSAAADLDDEPESALTSSDSDQSVSLLVGETYFRGKASVYAASSTIMRLIADNGKGIEDPEYPGVQTITVDVDPEMFSHILVYLKTGRKPLFFARSGHHDIARYHLLLHEAEYLNLQELYEWVRDRGFETELSEIGLGF